MPEASDFELGETDYEEETTFPPPERRIVTQPYDLSVNTLVEQWDDNLLVVPELQRDYVWDNSRASRLIESLMLNLPIPPVYLAENAAAQYEIIDGHQRIRSIVRFIKNEFQISPRPLQEEFKRLRFHQLPEREQRFLRTRVLRAIVVGIDSHPSMKFEIFQRLNTGAIALNAKEIRNALYQGSFNDCLHRLTFDAAFRQAIGTKAARNRMVDEELVLRFFGLRTILAEYRPPLLRALNDFMRENRQITEAGLEAIEHSFVSSANFTARCFPEGAYRVSDEEGHPIDRNVNRALFDAQMLAASWVEPTAFDSTGYPEIRRLAANLFKRQDFLDAIGRATGDRRRTLIRVRMYAEMLRDAGVAIEMPEFLASAA